MSRSEDEPHALDAGTKGERILEVILRNLVPESTRENEQAEAEHYTERLATSKTGAAAQFRSLRQPQLADFMEAVTVEDLVGVAGRKVGSLKVALEDAVLDVDRSRLQRDIRHWERIDRVTNMAYDFNRRGH